MANKFDEDVCKTLLELSVNWEEKKAELVSEELLKAVAIPEEYIDPVPKTMSKDGVDLLKEMAETTFLAPGESVYPPSMAAIYKAFREGCGTGPPAIEELKGKTEIIYGDDPHTRKIIDEFCATSHPVQCTKCNHQFYTEDKSFTQVTAVPEHKNNHIIVRGLFNCPRCKSELFLEQLYSSTYTSMMGVMDPVNETTATRLYNIYRIELDKDKLY